MLRRGMGIVGTLMMLIAAVVVVPQRGKAADTENVFVVNGPKKPVPVSLAAGGSVGIAGTVNANVTNTPNVNVTGLPAVQLVAGTNVGISGTPNVNVANQPTVGLAGGTNVGINGTPNVNVANTPNVNVTGLPAVQLAPGTNVGINGTPNVNVANMPTVTLAAGATVGLAPGTVVGARNADALQPVQLSVPLTLPAGTMGNDILAYTVPPGKRLVIEEFSGIAFLPAGQRLLRATVNLPTGTFPTVPTFTGPADATTDEYVWGRLMRAYADQGQQVRAGAFRSSTVGSALVFFSISGYLVDV